MHTKILFLFFAAIVIASCGGSENTSPGQQIFVSNCSSCHGLDGKLGASGAKDLSVSTVDPNLSRTIITSGKGSMPSFKQVLTPEQIEQVITYINTLRK